MSTLSIPLVRDGFGDIVPAKVSIHLIDAAGRPRQGWSVTTGYPIQEHRALALSEEDLEIDLVHQADIAIDAEASPTYYQITIASAVHREQWRVQLPTGGPHTIPVLIAAAAMDGADLIAGRLLSLDERAGFDAGTAITAENPPATMSDLAGSVSGVASFNGRTGAVLPAADDYSADQIDLQGTPDNYTPESDDVAGHLAGIDTALAGAGDITAAVQAVIASMQASGALPPDPTGLADGTMLQIANEAYTTLT